MLSEHDRCVKGARPPVVLGGESVESAARGNRSKLSNTPRLGRVSKPASPELGHFVDGLGQRGPCALDPRPP